MRKPIRYVHFEYRHPVPVYSRQDMPRRIYNVSETLESLKVVFADREKCATLDQETYEAYLRQFAHYSILEEIGCPTWPITGED